LRAYGLVAKVKSFMGIEIHSLGRGCCGA